MSLFNSVASIDGASWSSRDSLGSELYCFDELEEGKNVDWSLVMELDLCIKSHLAAGMGFWSTSSLFYRLEPPMVRPSIPQQTCSLTLHTPVSLNDLLAWSPFATRKFSCWGLTLQSIVLQNMPEQTRHMKCVQLYKCHLLPCFLQLWSFYHLWFRQRQADHLTVHTQMWKHLQCILRRYDGTRAFGLISQSLWLDRPRKVCCMNQW